MSKQKERERELVESECVCVYVCVCVCVREREREREREGERGEREMHTREQVGDGGQILDALVGQQAGQNGGCEASCHHEYAVCRRTRGGGGGALPNKTVCFCFKKKRMTARRVETDRK